MTSRLQRVFRDEDGLRCAVVTGAAAGDLVYVDLATGALPMADAVAQEALKRGFDVVVSINAQGELIFGTPDAEARFRRASEAASVDPNAPAGAGRPIRGGQGVASSQASATQAAQQGTDALLAAIGRLERGVASSRDRYFLHFTDLGTLLTPGTVPGDRAKRILMAVGRLLAAGKGHSDSRLLVTLPQDVRADGIALLRAHDHGASAWDEVDMPLPAQAEIAVFLDRARDRHQLTGSVPATALMLANRRYTLTRISETLRRTVESGDRNLTSIIGGEHDAQAVAAVEARLDKLVGLDDLKREFRKLVGSLAAIQDALRRGQVTQAESTHLALLGRPGTGKTEVAKLIAELLHAAGVRRRNVCIRATTADIVGAYNSGEAIQNVRRLLHEAADGVLFLDEAYTLAENDWARQAVDVLVAEMDERRAGITVILAGYPDRMRRLFEANAGLKSRLAYEFHLPDYTPEQLCEIWERMARGANVEIDSAARTAAHSIIRREATRPHGNARDVRNLWERWNRERLVARAPRLQSEHVVDPRPASQERAKDRIQEYQRRFSGNLEVEAWLATQLSESFDNLSRGLLPKAPRLAFVGPPGTGKTESARLVGDFLRECGVLREGRVIDTTLKDFTGEYVGQTAVKTERILKDAAENVLFIDEIYAFVADQQGREILNQLVPAMTKPEYANVAIIVAGYADRMPDVYRANSGLQGRIHATVHFAWPDGPTLAEIALGHLVQAHERSPAAADRAEVKAALVRALEVRRAEPGFAGARTAKSLADSVAAKAVGRGGAERSVVVADVPAPPPAPSIRRTVAKYLDVFPGSADLVPKLEQVLANFAMHRDQRPPAPAALGVCLTGGPGTGKSTFARWIVREFADRPGAAPAPMIERSALSLQGVHLGEAQANVRRAFEDARGGCLFLDEFHALHQPGGGQQSLYSVEIARELVAQMTSPSNVSTVVILAGYPGPMRGAMSLDFGLAGRFETAVELPQPSGAILASAAYHALALELPAGVLPELGILSGILEAYFERMREREGDAFAGFRAVAKCVRGIKRRALLRADGDSARMVIELDDVFAEFDS